MITETDNRAQEQAAAKLDGIKEMMKRYNHANECGAPAIYDEPETCQLTDEELKDGLGDYNLTRNMDRAEMIKLYHDGDKAQEIIMESILSVETRGPWHQPTYGDPAADTSTDAEYKILLCTGGPAVQIYGELDNGQPTTAVLQFQDWFTPWADYRETTTDDDDILLQYASMFLSC